jgi:hypothetical protein
MRGALLTPRARRSSARAAVLLVGGLLMSGCGGPGSQSAEQPEPVPAPATVEVEVEVEVFFVNDTLGDPCGEVFPVTRTVAADDPVTGALHALLAGPTATEQAEGYGGWFSSDTADALLDAHLDDGTVHVTFADLRELLPDASSSCGASALLTMLDTTLLALDGVTATRYAIADQTAFYTWLQLDGPDAPVPEAPPEVTEPEATESVPPDAPSEAPPSVEDLVTLRGDGLGLIDFGTPADEALAVLTGVIGTPPNDPGETADWVEYIGWADLGLYVGTSTPQWIEYDEVSRFIGWTLYERPGSRLTLMSPAGMSIGMTITELQALFGDRLVVGPSDPDPWDDQTPGPQMHWSFRVEPVGQTIEPRSGEFDGDPHDVTARVSVLRAGIGVGW